jgi:hypothetical protein
VLVCEPDELGLERAHPQLADELPGDFLVLREFPQRGFVLRDKFLS